MTQIAKPAKPEPMKPAKVEHNSETHVMVRTTGPFMLLDMSTGAEIEPETDTLVPISAFIQRRLKIKDLVEV